MSNNPGVTQLKESKNQRLINVLSVTIPLAVATILGIRTKIDLGEWTRVLPHVIAVINTATSILLLIGVYFIKRHQIVAHRNSMLGAFVLGALFLVCYILYHISNPSTPFGGEGLIRPVYYFFLISHIVLSIVVVRFVLLAVHYAVTDQIIRHRKVVKYAFPIWLYVSVTGVIVYLMISPYYNH
jgi:putative membrane protein